MNRTLPITICCLSILAGSLAAGNSSKAEPPSTKFARGRHGMVATGSPYATQAAVRILESGGNAIDAAAAAHLAMMVVDPANTSLGGRAQILIRLREGRVVAIDGATQAPASVTPLASADEDRRGYAAAPVPGGLAALAEMVRKHGRKQLPEVIQPSVELAEEGFVVPARLAASWERFRESLIGDQGAAANFLKPDGSAYREGEVFRQPRLAKVLRRIAASGTDVFYRGAIADEMARDVAGKGGFIRKEDLREYRPLPGVVVRTTYRGYQVATAGGRAWGNTLVEMLNILDNFRIGQGEPSARDIEIVARVIAQSLEDRPQEIGTLKPKKDGYQLSTLSSREFGAERAEMIKRKMAAAGSAPNSNYEEKEGDTTHLSVMDAEGNAVSLTTSIGPSFGSRVAAPELGFLYAHSYRMRSDSVPKSRDHTEMTPTIVFRGEQPILVIGAAGSERIPTAILQVISNLFDRKQSLEQAISAPRLLCIGRKLRIQQGFNPDAIETLRNRNFEIELVERRSSQHLGLVQAVWFDAASKEFFGAADPEADGSADGPKRTKH
jgi:gamma-glutamyltranspeptidase/glutathione hydrolase